MTRVRISKEVNCHRLSAEEAAERARKGDVIKWEGEKTKKNCCQYYGTDDPSFHSPSCYTREVEETSRRGFATMSAPKSECCEKCRVRLDSRYGEWCEYLYCSCHKQEEKCDKPLVDCVDTGCRYHWTDPHPSKPKIAPERAQLMKDTLQKTSKVLQDFYIHTGQFEKAMKVVLDEAATLIEFDELNSRQ